MPQFRFNTISRTDIEESVGGAQMLFGIDYDGPSHLLITGPPGSGKTTVSIMRAERLIAANKNILLFTHQDLLWRSLSTVASQKLKRRIHVFYRWWVQTFKQRLEDKDTVDQMLKVMEDWNGVEEIIIDEGQDLDARVYSVLLKKAKTLTVGADNAQKVYRNGLKSQQIKDTLSHDSEAQQVPLAYNYRNTFEIYDFARHFLPQNEIVNNRMTIDRLPKGDGDKPTYFLVPDHSTRAHQLKILLTNAGDRNIAILVFGTDEVDEYAKLIRSIGFKCSSHHSKENHLGSNIENIIVTTLQSAKGLEFQVVILPNMETAMDRIYKSQQHYFVGCTRAKENLFLIGTGLKVPRCMNHFNTMTYDLVKVDKNPFPKTTESIDDLPF